MANIVIVSCNTTVDPFPVYPLGASLITNALRADGHKTTLFDLHYEKDDRNKLSKLLKDEGPDYVGMSIRNFDNVKRLNHETYLENYVDIINQIRNDCNINTKVIIGGSAFTILPEEIMKYTKADWGIVGEGELTICKLIKDLESGNPPKHKILYPFELVNNLLPSSKYREPNLTSYYQKASGMLNVQAKRGCPHRCAYCSYPSLEGNCYRFRDSKEVVDEIEFMINKYNMDYYMFTDSVFNDSKGKYKEILHELINRGIDVPWSCYLRPKGLNEQDADLLIKAGLHAIEWGSDCATDRTLKGMNKGFNWQSVVDSHRIFSEKGIPGSFFIIFGGPGETKESVIEGLENIDKLSDSIVVAGTGIRIFPNTPIVEIARKEGIIDSLTSLVDPHYYISKDVDLDWMHNKIVEAFNGRDDRLYSDKALVEKTAQLHDMGVRGPGWHFLLKRRRMIRKRG